MSVICLFSVLCGASLYGRNTTLLKNSFKSVIKCICFMATKKLKNGEIYFLVAA